MEEGVGRRSVGCTVVKNVMLSLWWLGSQVAGGADGAALREVDVVLTTYSVIENEYRRYGMEYGAFCPFFAQVLFPRKKEFRVV